MMMDSIAVALRTQLRTPSSAGRRPRSVVDPGGTDRLPRDRRTSVRSRCPSTSNDRPWSSATPFEEDEPDEEGLMDGTEGLPEVMDQPATTWDGFDQHIRCIATTDPREQYTKKRSTDKASDTYKATMREIYGSLERLDMSDSDKELPAAIVDASREEVLARQMSVEASRKTHRKVKDVREQPEGETRTASAAGWRTETVSGQHRRPYQQQQQHLDENATKRTMLYEKYLERQNVWAEGLTKSGKEILLAIQRRKNRSSRFPVSPSNDDVFHRTKMVRSTTWCSNSNARSGFHGFTPAVENSLSCNG